MKLTYSLGMDETIWSLYAVAIACSLYGAYAVLKAVVSYRRPNVLITGLLAMIIMPIAVAAGIFPIIFSTINLFYQNFLDPNFWKQEVSSGVFALRITSISLTFQAGNWLIHFIHQRKTLINLQREMRVYLDRAADYRKVKDIGVARLWRSSDLTMAALAQIAFYLLALSTLWICVAFEVNSIFRVLASWCIFFIVDDATVVFEYSHHFEQTPLPKHFYKLTAFNFAVIGSMIPIYLSAAGSRIYFILYGMTLIVLALASAALLLRAKHFTEKIARLEARGHETCSTP